MLDEAHKRGLELHAWVNPYRVTMPSHALSDLAADNVARKNPSWVVKYGKQYYLNPGLPEVQNYLLSTIEELVSNYDIDAVHMDDYFYPYKIKGETFQDQQTFKKYGGSFNNIEDWRRNNVNQLVKKRFMQALRQLNLMFNMEYLRLEFGETKGKILLVVTRME